MIRIFIIGLWSLLLLSNVAAKEKWELREEACAAEYKRVAERVMCNDRQLTRMDAELNEYYLHLKDVLEPPEFEELQDTQRTWLKIRNNCGADYQCIFVLYQSRNVQLEHQISNLDADFYNEALYAGGPLSCAQWSRVKTQREDESKTITFVNKREGGRAVMYFDLEGQWHDVGWIEPNESLVVSTYMTQPWMFTDGPGNCIEMFMPHPEMDTFELRIPSMYFGPEND